MPKAAIVILADTESHGDMGRVANALEAVKEFKEAGDEVQLLFDGAGTKWIAELSKPDSRMAPLYAAVKDKIAGVCGFCAGAFQVTEAVKASGIAFASEYEGHPSFRKLVAEGFEVITF